MGANETPDTSMHEEYRAAVDWWCVALRGHCREDNGDLFHTAFKKQIKRSLRPLSEEQIAKFRSKLWALLTDSNIPIYLKSRLSVDYCPSGILAEAAAYAEIDGMLYFPCKTSVLIEPGSVVLRNGYASKSEWIYPPNTRVIEIRVVCTREELEEGADWLFSREIWAADPVDRTLYERPVQRFIDSCLETELDRYRTDTREGLIQHHDGPDCPTSQRFRVYRIGQNGEPDTCILDETLTLTEAEVRLRNVHAELTDWAYRKQPAVDVTPVMRYPSDWLSAEQLQQLKEWWGNHWTPREQLCRLVFEKNKSELRLRLFIKFERHRDALARNALWDD